MVRGDERVKARRCRSLAEAAGQSVTLESGQVVTLSDMPGVSVRLNEFRDAAHGRQGFRLEHHGPRGQVETTQLAGTPTRCG